MLATMPTAHDAAAALLASVLSANGRIEARQAAERDRLRACRTLGIERERL